MTTHKIKKGFDLPLAGCPERVLADAAEPAHVALETFEFAGIKPKVLVKEGDLVETGQPVYLNKLDRDIVWCAPASGTVKSIEFGISYGVTGFSSTYVQQAIGWLGLGGGRSSS